MCLQAVLLSFGDIFTPDSNAIILLALVVVQSTLLHIGISNTDKPDESCFFSAIKS